MKRSGYKNKLFHYFYESEPLKATKAKENGTEFGAWIQSPALTYYLIAGCPKYVTLLPEVPNASSLVYNMAQVQPSPPPPQSFSSSPPSSLIPHLPPQTRGPTASLYHDTVVQHTFLSRKTV